MSSTFETVLKQANELPVAERRRLVEALKNANGGKKRSKKWDDDPTIKTLRAWVDEIEASTDPRIRASIDEAERIRKMNDRVYEL